eukprot:UN10683
MLFMATSIAILLKCIKIQSNKLSLLLSNDTKGSLLTPYPSRQTSPKATSYLKNQAAYSCSFLQKEYCSKSTLNDFINTSNRIPHRDNNNNAYIITNITWFGI